jgi:hypothetical protein
MYPFSFGLWTSSWLKTPSDIRKLGGALFADRRYGNVFVHHNSAPSSACRLLAEFSPDEISYFLFVI